MANNIEALNQDMQEKAEEAAQASKEVFRQNETLTDEDRQWAEEQEAIPQTAVVESFPGGGEKTTPVSEYAQKLDQHVKEIDAMTEQAAQIKAVNKGDVVKTVADIRNEVKQNAIRAFRELSLRGTDDDEDDMSDDEILKINDEALQAVQKYLDMPKLDSDVILKRFYRMPLRQICSILPKRFVDIYVREAEIKADNYKAKERLLTSLSYLTATGPELDYLNDYIDNEHRLMALSHELMKTQTDFAKLLQSPGKMSEIVEEALRLDPPEDDTEVWKKYIQDPRRVHNEFAQNAAIMAEYKTTYIALLNEHVMPPEDEIREKVIARFKETKVDYTEYDVINAIEKERDFYQRARAEIQEQIDESDTKMNVYLSVTKMEKMKELWKILVDRFMADKKMGYQSLIREATNAMDRIRRAKQNVMFPVFDEKLAKRPADLAMHFVREYPEALKLYNSAIRSILEKTGDFNTDVVPISLDEIDDDTTYHYFSLLLLILYGRIMKALGDNGETKYDAIMLDSYFIMLCRMATDVYVMTDVWMMMKDFIAYAIQSWPKPAERPKGGKKK